MTSIRINPELAEFLSLAVDLEDVVGVISSNLPYILALEYGHSGQAPEGMVRKFVREYDAMLVAELTEALRVYGRDFQRAAEAGISSATLEIMRAIAERTPVDTGRAKGSWTATLPGGKRFAPGPDVSEAQQRAIRRARGRKAR